MAINFNLRESVTHMDDSGRQLDFKLDDLGRVTVDVRYGLSIINTVAQRNLFYEDSPTAPSISLTQLTPAFKKKIIEDITHDKVDLQIVNGGRSDVQKRNTVGVNYFHRIHQIIIKK